MDQPVTPGGLVWRTVLTVIVLAGALVGSLWYVAFEAKGFSLFQQLAVVLIAFIIAVAIVSIVWITWAGRRGWMRAWH
jgi:hypothetical protein